MDVGDGRVMQLEAKSFGKIPFLKISSSNSLVARTRAISMDAECRPVPAI
jgi:hypothetical protein